MNLKAMYDAVMAAEARKQALAAQINKLFEENKISEALDLQPQFDKAKADANQINQMYLSMVAENQPDKNGQRFVPMGGDRESTEIKSMRASNEYMQAFFDAFRAGISPKDIKSGKGSAETYKILMDAYTTDGGAPAGSEGGFLLPVDFDNKIIELMRQFVDISGFASVEEVVAFSGWRAVETATAMLPFAALSQNADMDEAEESTFTKVTYQIVDYGGYIPVSNDLIADTPVNIMNYLSGWMAKKVVLTDNSLMFALINALTPVPVTDNTQLLWAIKTALNKTLDPDIAASAIVMVNQTGFDLLDQLVDGLGRPMLMPDPTNATVLRLLGRQVVKVADRLWPNLSGNTYAPVLVSGMKELITFFRRAVFEMAATTIGGEAWRKNNTEVRGIMRADAEEVDSAAGSLLQVTL